MRKATRKRKPGDLEIRILQDGKVVLVAPDEALMDVAQAVDPNNAALTIRRKTQHDKGQAQ